MLTGISEIGSHPTDVVRGGITPHPLDVSWWSPQHRTDMAANRTVVLKLFRIQVLGMPAT